MKILYVYIFISLFEEICCCMVEFKVGATLSFSTQNNVLLTISVIVLIVLYFIFLEGSGYLSLFDFRTIMKWFLAVVASALC